MKAQYKRYKLTFKQASGTSRGILKTKETYFIILQTKERIAYGETGLFRGLSCDDLPNYEEKLAWACSNIHLGLETLVQELVAYPSIQFGLEQAFKSLEQEDATILFPSDFTKGEKGIPINGLIWMGDPAFMQAQIEDKLLAGFDTIKLKIGAIDFDTELQLLRSIRDRYSSEEITLRVDANGAFSPENALGKLEQLAALDIHSIEQPIKQGQWQEMARLCEETPLAIALDEELIGIPLCAQKQTLLDTINPQYIILKPSLVGGFQGTDQWIDIATKKGIPNWITSALESNIGLSAIAQYTYSLQNPLAQGLGTGGLFTNNIPSPLYVEQGYLWHNANTNWQFKNIL